MRDAIDRFSPAVKTQATRSYGHSRERRQAGTQLLRKRLERGASRPTTTVERLLLMGAISLLPLENHFPSVGGFSVASITFAAIGLYLVLNRFRILSVVWTHRVFLTLFAFLLVASIVEPFHPNSSFSEIRRIGQMVVGAILIACLCRDEKALRAGVTGYILAGTGMALLLFATSYGALSGAVAKDFDEASRLRAEVFSDTPIQANLNGMAFVAAQGGIAALALALSGLSGRRGKLFLGLACFCFVASFLPLSRSGIVIAGVSAFAVMYAKGLKHPKILASVALLAIAIFIFVPDAVFSRLAFSTEGAPEEREGRARVYTAAWDNRADYLVVGIGAGNFWEEWGLERGFTAGGREKPYVVGAHNTLIQVAIYWGLLAVVPLIAAIYLACRCAPRRAGRHELSLCLVGIGASLLMYLLAMQSLYAKELAIGLGLLIGARRSVWPDGIVRPVSTHS